MSDSFQFRQFDWVIYSGALALILYSIFASQVPTPSPRPEPDLSESGPILPPPSMFDERLLIQTDAPKSGVGTAFAINDDGYWMTARHVIDGCDKIGLRVFPGRFLRAEVYRSSRRLDIAVLKTEAMGEPVALDLDQDLRVGMDGFMAGFPQGRPGEVAGRLMARSTIQSRGTHTGTESVLVWAENGRTTGLVGTLGGLSGGPVFDSSGNVRGLVIAENPRRGRVYTSAPSTMEHFVNAANLSPAGEDAGEFSSANYGPRSDKVRRELKVVQVACEVYEDE